MAQATRYRVRVTFETGPTDSQIDALMEVFTLATSISGDRMTAEVWSSNSVDTLRRLAVGLAEAGGTDRLPAVKQVRLTAL